MNKKKLNEITRISHAEVVEPDEYWALFADAYYEDLFSKITERDELLNAYKHWLKNVPPGKPRAALTFFYRLRRDELDDKFDWSLIEQLEKKVTEFVKLFESPDRIYYKGDDLTFGDREQAIAFGQHKGKMYVVRRLGMAHLEITHEPKPGKTKYFDRIDFKYPGRLWYKDKIISFWEYPSIKEMPKILQDLEKAVKETLDISLGLLSDPEWRIEIITEKEDDTDAPAYKFDWRGVGDTDIIPLKDYIGSAEWSPEEKAKAHVMSPMDKAKKLTSKPSEYFKHQKRKPLAWRQAMYAESYNDIKFPRLKLFEDPDRVDGGITWHDAEALPFGYYEDKMYVGEFENVHSDIAVIDPKSGERIPTLRRDFKYGGRLWHKSKIISFWEYPSKNEMRKVLSDIEEAFKERYNFSLNLLTDPGWKIEIITGTREETKERSPKSDFDWGGAYDTDIIPLKDYIGSKEWSPEEKAKAHVMSPMEKAKKLTSKSSAYFKHQKRKPLAWRQAMHAESYKDIKFPRLKLFENPDRIETEAGVVHRFVDSDAYPFGYINGKMVVRPAMTMHGDFENSFIIREDYTYPGRIWIDDKIISFWNYPEPEEMPKVLRDLEKEFDADKDLSISIISDPEWEIELADGTIVSLKDYIGSEERSPEELAKDHVMSPMEKAKKLTSKSSDYFKSQKRKPLAWRQAMQAESYNDIKFPRLKLFESPDGILLDEYNVVYDDTDALPFGYHKDKMYIGKFGSTHNTINVFKTKLKIFQIRKKLKYSGRLWVKSKLITFWHYPPKNKMKEVLSDIENAVKEQHNISLGLLSDPNWDIEILIKPARKKPFFQPEETEIIPLQNYIGSKEWSSEELAKDHVMSPMEKAKKRTSKSSDYFKSQKRKPLAWRQAMQAESEKAKYAQTL